MPTKVRTQIQLEPRQYERLKELAHRRRLSLSGVLRAIVDQALAIEQEEGAGSVREARTAFVGSGRDAGRKRDVARRHDRYLYGGAK